MQGNEDIKMGRPCCPRGAVCRMPRRWGGRPGMIQQYDLWCHTSIYKDHGGTNAGPGMRGWVGPGRAGSGGDRN